MIRILITFFLISTVSAQSWVTPANVLITGEGDIKKASQELEQMKDLDQKILSEITSEGKFSSIAIELVRVKKKSALIPDLLAYVKNSKKVTPIYTKTLVTIVALSIKPENNKYLQELTQIIDIEDPKISSAMKIAMLNAMYENRIAINKETISKILSDESYELRVKILSFADFLSEKDAISIYKLSITKSPSNLRAQTVLKLKTLGPEFKSEITKMLQKCATEDQSEEIKKLCRP